MEIFVKKSFFVLVCSIFIVGMHLCQASINFGSRDSKIKIWSGARLNVNNSAFGVDGTISQEEGGQITGEAFTFDNGILEQDGAEALLNGTFDPSATEVLQFSGDGVLRGEPGNVIYGVLISGVNNVISGQPTFVLPIRMLDDSSVLLMDIQNALSKDINLNGGSLNLVNDLALADDVKIVGPGRVSLGNRQLTFGGFYRNSWDETLGFVDASSLVLTGSIKLDSTWFFYGDCNINGNGAVLDLSDGGKIVLAPNANVYIEDLVIKGLGDTAGQIIFSSDDSNLYLSNVDACLSEAYTLTIGNIIVEGSSSFVLGSFNWDINTLANLTVDGVTLWLDTLGSGTTVGAGELKVSRPVYDVNGYNAANVAANISDGTLEYLNGGFINLMDTSGSNFIDPAAAILLGGDVHVDVTMNYFIDVPSNGQINITGDMTLNGGGSTINFPNSGIPQFIVNPGVTVHLTNITLANINHNTFLIYPGGQIIIGEDVVWSFVEDVTFDVRNSIVVTADNNFTWVGVDGVKYITLTHNTEPNAVILNIENSTLTLENIVLDGVAHIGHNSNSLIHLNGESGINIDQATSLNFKASGAENGITLLTDALTLSGLIVFGNKAINELHIAFSLFNGLSANAGTRKDPLVSVSGGPGIIVGGPECGESRLIFDNPRVVLDLQDQNAIQLDINANLIYQELNILTNPIMQLTTRILTSGNQMDGMGIDVTNARSRASTHVKISKTDKKVPLRQVPECFDSIVNSVNLSNSIFDTFDTHENLQKAYLDRFFMKEKQDVKKNRIEMLRSERFDDFEDENLTRGTIRLSRANIVEPDVYDSVIFQETKNLETPISGSVECRDAVITNLFVDSTLPLNLFIKQRSQIYQGSADVWFNAEKHKVNVIGNGQVINVQKKMHFDKNLFIDQNSSLEFKFVPTGYEDVSVIFEPGTVIEIPENSTLIFSGAGNVILSEGVIIRLLATENSKTKTITNKSSLIFKDGATLDFASGANAKIEGMGNIIIENSSSIKPSVPCSLTIGSSESDDISVKVSGDSQVCLECPFIEGYARISMQKLTTSLSFEKGGFLTVGANGIFEINALNGNLSRGVVTDISFKNNGTLVIKDNGLFVVASNRVAGKFNQYYDFSWGGFLANIAGGGFVQYIDTNSARSFIAKVFALSDSLFEDISSLDFYEFAKLLASKEPSLLTTCTLLERPDGICEVITRNDVKVTLLPGDVIEYDDPSGTIYGENNGNRFTISADGIRA